MEINRIPRHNVDTGTTSITWLGIFQLLTVQGLGHNPGQSSLAGTAHAAEDQGMGNPVLMQGVAKGSDNGLLTDYLGKGLGPGFSGKNKVGQNEFQGSGFRVQGSGLSPENLRTFFDEEL
jgi:hypothetical protein